jgi:large subunit ribosomal protein L6
VEVKVEGRKISIKGAKGTLAETLPETLKANVADNAIHIEPVTASEEIRPAWGLFRMLISNMVDGVTQGYRKNLEIQGVGYKAELKGKDLALMVGLSHPATIKAIPGITFTVENQTKIGIAGINKQLVGQVAADIRAVRPPEIYKGKGIRYEGEHIKLKAGKAAVK